MEPSLILTAITAFITALLASGIWAVIAQRKKTKAEADNLTANSSKIIQEAAQGLIMAYKERIEELEREVKELTERVESLEDKLKDAYLEIKRLLELNKQLNKK